MKFMQGLMLAMACGLTMGQSVGTPKPAAPLDPVTAILDAFSSNSIVALGEPHGNEQAAAFRLDLIRNPRFADVVTDLVIEAGNSRYQDVVDRFVSGQPVPDETLRQAWQNTTVANFVWERPIYEQFVRGVREVNASLPKQKRLRLLLGDPPVDWNTIHSPDDLLKWLMLRDSSAAAVVRDQVLAKRRRALVIYGEGHFWRHNAGNNLVARLEAQGTKVFAISTPITADLASVQPGVSAWPQPSLAILRGTLIGAQSFQSLFGIQSGNGVRYEDQMDAVLYLGPPSSMTTSMLPARLCADQQYRSMRLGRMALDPGPPGSPAPSDALKRNCPTNR